jgi:predicted transcriptional regulator
VSCSREQVIEAIQRLANGTPLVNVCRDMGIPRSTLYYVINNDSDLLDMLARAREEYAEARVCEMQEIAETVEDVGRARLMCDNIKWEAARMAPKKYGDRTAIDVDGSLNISNMSDEDLNDKLANLLAKAGTPGAS